MASAPQPLPPEVLAALSNGRIIEAIKLLRQHGGLGLAEAKHAVESHVRQGPAHAASPAAAAPPGMASLSQTLPAAAVAALQAGNKIEAIRLHREHTGLGLKEAKDAVEAFAASHPPMDPNLAPGEVPRGSGWGGWVAAAAIVLLLAYWLLRR